MQYVITYHTPICPVCRSAMIRIHQHDGFFYICNDEPVHHIYKELGGGQAECESVITDNVNDILNNEVDDGK